MGQSTYALVFAFEGHARLLQTALDGPMTLVRNRAECVAALKARRPTMVFIDLDLLPNVESELVGVNVIAIVDGTVDAIVDAFNEFPQLAHVVSTTLLSQPHAKAYVAALRERLTRGDEPRAPNGATRVLGLTTSANREAQLDHMCEFFASHVESKRRLAVIRDIAEELVTNALYDAPAEAGYFPTAVSRTVTVEFPARYASEFSYGVEARGAFVRMRDPFGALTRGRLRGVLNRCNMEEVQLDETRGGAGLGLWRVFTSAAAVSIAVIPRRLTDVLVWIDTKKTSKAGNKQLLAAHLYLPAERPDDRVGDHFAREEDDELNYEDYTLDAEK